MPDHGTSSPILPIDRVGMRLGSLIVVMIGLLFAALHYWPPHG
jgi:hypothetical protein